MIFEILNRIAHGGQLLLACKAKCAARNPAGFVNLLLDRSTDGHRLHRGVHDLGIGYHARHARIGCDLHGLANHHVFHAVEERHEGVLTRAPSRVNEAARENPQPFPAGMGTPAILPQMSIAPPNNDRLAQAGLSDKQGRKIEYLRVSVTDRCNYRCTYCMPEDGIEHALREDILSFEELEQLATCFARLGVKHLRITGGEPTVRRDLVPLVLRLRGIVGIETVALSTNGERLEEFAAPLWSAGLRRLNVSLDSLRADRFLRITRRGDLGRVLSGLQTARAAGFAQIKLNTVAIKGFNDDEVGELCEYAFANGFVPRFIEVMPMAGGGLFVPGQLLSAAEIRERIVKHFGNAVVPDADGRLATGGMGPARYFKVQVAGQAQRFGIISPMTEHFCDDCNRVRLSSAGHLHSCLAYDDALDLRAVLQTGGPERVMEAILRAVSEKRDGHVFQVSGIGGPKKAMIAIGG